MIKLIDELNKNKIKNIPFLFYFELTNDSKLLKVDSHHMKVESKVQQKAGTCKYNQAVKVLHKKQDIIKNGTKNRNVENHTNKRKQCLYLDLHTQHQMQRS